MKQLYCEFFGHDLKITKNVTYHIKEYECKHCKEKFTTSQYGGIVSLTQKRKEINSILERVHLKRLKYKTTKLAS